MVNIHVGIIKNDLLLSYVFLLAFVIEEEEKLNLIFPIQTNQNLFEGADLFSLSLHHGLS